MKKCKGTGEGLRGWRIGLGSWNLIGVIRFRKAKKNINVIDSIEDGRKGPVYE